MRSRFRSARFAVLATLALLAGACSGDDGGPADTTTTTVEERDGDRESTRTLPEEVALPIVFVHGFAGSAQQYETQAMRFAANGYPQERIVAFEHDGAGFDIDGYVAGLAGFVDRTLEETDAEQVHLVGHSRGTMVSSRFLSDPARAAKVAKYVALDGAPCPDAVPCLEVTKESIPGQSHVEVATSAESFASQFEFLLGEAPETVDVVPQDGPVQISGRAVIFPANTGRSGAKLEIWEVDSGTGQRTGDSPHASAELGPEGEFGPVEVEPGAHYEYVLSATDSAVQHHLYLQPYVRDSSFVRLLSSEPDGPVRTNTNLSDDHTALVVMRMREWYATDLAETLGDQRDSLTVEVVGRTEPADVLEDFVGNATIGIHLHDDAASPAATTLAPIAHFAAQPFQSGVDVHIPASPDGTGTIRVVNVPRGDVDRPQTLNLPNWPSSTHAVSVVFADHPVD